MQLEQCLVLLCIKLIDNWKVALERCILQFSELLLSLEEKREVSLLRRWRFILRAVGVLCWKNNLKAPGGIRFTELLGPNQISNFCSIPTDSSHPKEHKQGIPQYDEYMESHLHFVLLHFITPHITRLGFRLNVALTCVYICLKGKVCPKKYLYLVLHCPSCMEPIHFWFFLGFFFTFETSPISSSCLGDGCSVLLLLKLQKCFVDHGTSPNVSSALGWVDLFASIDELFL